MKIALLHYSAPPIVGGVESVIAQHALLMADAGHEVSIIAGRGASFDPHIALIQLPLLDSRNPDVLSVKAQLDHGLIPKEFYVITSNLITQLQPILSNVEVLIAHNVCSLHKNLALTAALKTLFTQGLIPRLILWHHDLAWTTPHYRAELHEGYPWELLRQDWPGARLVVVSRLRQLELAELIDISIDRIDVIPNGVNIGLFNKLEMKTLELVDRLNLLDSKPLILLPVRITPRKNIELSLAVVNVLRQVFPQVKLIVTGPLGPHNPSNQDYFEKLVSIRDELGLASSVHFLAELSDEYLPDSVILDFYHLSDALFLPSREEGFGIPILEAAVAGMPIFCSDIPPLHDLADRFADYFSPDGDPHVIASQIDRRLRDLPTFELRARVRASFSWERIYKKHISPLLM